MAITTPEQWRLIALCLGNGTLRRGRFKKALIKAMRKRERVCIMCLTEEVAQGLGGEYGDWAESVLRAAAKETFIEVTCPKGVHNG